MKQLSLTEARNRLLRLADELQREPDTVVEVTKHGRPVLAVLSSQLYESLVETLEILCDEEQTRKLQQALREVEQGKAIPWDKARRKLGLEA